MPSLFRNMGDIYAFIRALNTHTSIHKEQGENVDCAIHRWFRGNNVLLWHKHIMGRDDLNLFYPANDICAAYLLAGHGARLWHPCRWSCIVSLRQSYQALAMADGGTFDIIGACLS